MGLLPKRERARLRSGLLQGRSDECLHALCSRVVGGGELG